MSSQGEMMLYKFVRSSALTNKQCSALYQDKVNCSVQPNKLAQPCHETQTITNTDQTQQAGVCYIVMWTVLCVTTLLELPAISSIRVRAVGPQAGVVIVLDAACCGLRLI